MIEIGQDAEQTARREAREEPRVELTRLEPAGMVWSSPGVSTERITLFLAPYDKRGSTGAGGGVAGEHEAIIVRQVALSELAQAADAGSLADAKLLMLIQTLRLRRPELFVSETAFGS